MAKTKKKHASDVRHIRMPDDVIAGIQTEADTDMRQFGIETTVLIREALAARKAAR